MFINTGLQKKTHFFKWEKKAVDFCCHGNPVHHCSLGTKTGSRDVVLVPRRHIADEYLKVSDGWSNKMAGFYWRVDSLSLIIWLSLWILISGMCLTLFFEAFTTSLSTQACDKPLSFSVKQTFLFHETKKGHVPSPVTCPLKKRWLEDYFPLKWPLFRAHLCFRGV